MEYGIIELGKVKGADIVSNTRKLLTRNDAKFKAAIKNKFLLKSAKKRHRKIEVMICLFLVNAKC
jgi:hypothetical protein